MDSELSAGTSRLIAHFRSHGISTDPDEWQAAVEAYMPELDAATALLPKAVETLDNLQGDLRERLLAAFTSSPENNFFEKKYDAFQTDLVMDIFEDKPVPLTVFRLFLWTLKYDAMQVASKLAEDDNHGPLPADWRLWLAVGTADVITFQHHKIKTEREKIKEQLLATTQTPEVLSELLNAAAALDEKVARFNQVLDLMGAEYSQTVMEINQYNEGNRDGSKNEMSISEVLNTEINEAYPKIVIPDFHI